MAAHRGDAYCPRSKLSAQTRLRMPWAPLCSNSTAAAAWLTLLQQTEAIARAHVTLADALKDNISTRLKQTRVAAEEALKKVRTRGRKLQFVWWVAATAVLTVRYGKVKCCRRAHCSQHLQFSVVQQGQLDTSRQDLDKVCQRCL